MTDNDVLVACKNGANVWESHLREAAPMLAARHANLVEAHREMTELYTKEQDRLDFEENMRRELAAELRRVKELLFGAMDELPEGNVIRSTYLGKYDKERPRWA